MNPKAYIEMARTEDSHWWFVGRRGIAYDAIARLNLPLRAQILEVGSGTGGNFTLLEQWGTVTAIEMNPIAREISLEKKSADTQVLCGKCPDGMPATGARYDLICLFDVLEHIEDEVAALRHLLGLLAPGGRLLMTVPAYAWLWSSHDVYLHHFRRYDIGLLSRSISAAGGTLCYCTYFNTILLPVVAFVRFLGRILRVRKTLGTALPSPPVNVFLSILMRFERMLLRVTRFPCGTSILAIVK